MARAFFTRNVLMLAVFGVVVAASVAAGTRESVREILRAHDFMPMTAEAWRQLGDDVDRHLVEAAGDAGLVYGARERAMSALAVIGGPRAKEFLRQMIERPRVSPEILSMAVYSYARGFAKSDPADVGFVSVPLLEHNDWGVRHGAVRALGELGTKEADEALRRRQTRETHPAVQRALRAALRQPETDKR